MDDLIHVSLAIPCELHLGPARECHHCRQRAMLVEDLNEQLTHCRTIADILATIDDSNVNEVAT